MCLSDNINIAMLELSNKLLEAFNVFSMKYFISSLDVSVFQYRYQSLSDSVHCRRGSYFLVCALCLSFGTC